MARPRSQQLIVVPSGVPIRSANTQKAIANTTTTYTLSKAVAVTFPGTYRIEMTISAASTGPIYARIYKNGVAYGPEHRVASSVGTTFVDILGGWAIGDTIQLYCKGTSGNGDGAVEGFTIYGSYDSSNLPVPQGGLTTDTAV